MVFKLRHPQWRINRYRNSTRDQDAVETEEVITAGREHDRHGLRRLEPGFDQPRRYRLGAGSQVGISQIVFTLVLVVKMDVQLVRMPCYMPVEYLDQRLRLLRQCRTGRHDEFAHRFFRFLHGRVRGKQDQQQVTRGLDAGQGALRHADAEFAFGTQQQFNPSQAVHAEIALERTVERH